VDGDKIICQTHVTSPFLSVESIDEAILYMAEYSSVCSATKIQSRFWRMESYGCCPVNHNPLVLEKTQDLPILYEENSAFYMFKVDSFIENNNRISNNHFFYAIDFPQNVDIDEEVDWNLAVAVENMLSNEVMNS
jgi:CMP-N-acetylneuraminic acid synthetase